MRLAIALAFALFAGAARADALDDPSAFDHAFAASFYIFDACGDGEHGLIFRRALAARFAQCAFTPAAREKHRTRNSLQAKKSRDVMDKLIEEHGGFPMQLPGMEATCHQQRAAPDYVAVRDKLDSYSAGHLTAEQVLPSPCDAEAIAP